MEDELITLKTAKLAKEGGFNEKCDKAFINYYSEHYNGDRKYQIQLFHQNTYNGPNPIYQASTQSLLQRWLREIHKIEVSVTPIIENKYRDREGDYDNKDAYYQWMIWGKTFGIGDTYEEAFEEGLQEALKLIK